MDSEHVNERIPLIENEKQTVGSTKISENEFITPEAEHVNLKTAFFIMIGLSVGTGVLIMPFTVRQLGLVAWIFSLAGVTFIQCLCTYLLCLSTQHVLEKNGQIDATRDAFQIVSQYSCGRVLRKISVIFMYAASLAMCMSLLLVSGSTLAYLIPISTYSESNNIRIWSTIIICVLTPVMYLGTYSDVKVPAVIAIVTSLISAAAIIVNCGLHHYVYTTRSELTDVKPKAANQSFLISLGTLIFTTCGAAFTIPNITAIASTPKRLWRSIISCNVCLFLVLLVTGLVPYFVFGEYNLTSTISTFYVDINSKQGSGAAFKVITVVIQLLMLVHLTMASVLATNPCFLHLEEILHVPNDLNVKRVAVRTTCMLFILGLCLLVPQFESVVSIAGGVPLTFMGIFLPLIIYTNLFEMPMYKKIFIYFFLFVIILFIGGNLFFSLRSIISR